MSQNNQDQQKQTTIRVSLTGEELALLKDTVGSNTAICPSYEMEMLHVKLYRKLTIAAAKLDTILAARPPVTNSAPLQPMVQVVQTQQNLEARREEAYKKVQELGQDNCTEETVEDALFYSYHHNLLSPEDEALFEATYLV